MRFEQPRLTKCKQLLELGPKPELRETRVHPPNQQLKQSWGPLSVVPPDSQQPEERQDTQRDPEQPEPAPLAELARGAVVVVRAVADLALLTIWSLWSRKSCVLWTECGTCA